MPTHVLGLPLHPLAVHLPVVLVPLLALFTAGYVLVPRVRTRVGWALIALTLAAPPAVFAAKWSGQRLAAERMEELRGAPDAAAQAAAAINGHSAYGDVLLWLVIALAPLAWLFAAVASGRLERLARLRTPLLAVTGVLLVALSAASLWYALRAGHTGAAMLWGA